MQLAEPWLADDLERLDLRRADRVLATPAPTREHAVAIRRAVGSAGQLLVLEPDPARARAIAELPDIAVAVHRPAPGEHHGVFDAVLSAPFAMPAWPLATWASLARDNLRPGGRFVVDLPAQTLNDQIARAWRLVAGCDADLGALVGPTEAELAAALRQAGLRSVEVSPGTHLLHAENARAIADVVADALHATTSAREDLALTLVQRLGSVGKTELIVHRTRVHGIR